MSNPVMQALVDARVQERVQSQAQRDSEVARLCAERLNLPATTQPVGDDWTQFLHWCTARGLMAFPATPATCGLFVIDNSLLGIERLLEIIQAVSAAHSNAGAADPTLGPMVALAEDQVAPVTPPRSWKKEERLAFLQIPRPLQLVVFERDHDREKTLRQAQQDRAEALKQIKTFQKEREASANEISALNSELQKLRIKIDALQSEAAAA